MATISHLFLFFLVICYTPLYTLAQLAGTPPSCALSCIVPGNYQGCATSDTACLCTNPTAVTGVQACIRKLCTNSTDISAATTFVQQECNSLTSSPSATGTPSSTITVSAASEATSAVSGQNGTPSLQRSQWLMWWLVPGLLALYPAAQTLLLG